MNYKALAISAAWSMVILVSVQPRAAGAGAEIKATGTLTTTFVRDTLGNPEIVPERTEGGLGVLSRYSLSTYVSGSLRGKTLALQTVVRDDAVEKKAFQTNIGQFWGTLAGFEGSFSFIVHNVVDRSACPCPPGATPFEGKFVVVEGTGSGGLEGICGGGTLKTVVGVGTEYDYTFRFGKDCRAND